MQQQAAVKKRPDLTVVPPTGREKGPDKGGTGNSNEPPPVALDDRLEEADQIFNEAQAIFAFIDEATVSMSRTESRFIDDIHRESDYGMHLCFITALELMEKARNIMLPPGKGE